jgi:DNA-binding MarR family transcriptional regulator
MFRMQPEPSDERDDLLQRLLEEAHLLGSRLAQSHQRTADAVGIGVTDLLCLEMVSAGEPLTAGQLAEQVGLTPGAVTGVLDRLERGGFIERERDPEDRRRILVRLDPTRQRDMARLLDPLAGALAEVTVDTSDADLRRITDFLARLHPAIASELARLRPKNAVRDTGPTTVLPRHELAEARLEVAAGLFDVVVTSGRLGDDLLRSTFDGQQPRIQRDGAAVTIRQRRLSSYFGWAGPGVIRLNDEVVWDVAFSGGSLRLQLELRDLSLSGLSLRGGHKLAARLPPPVGTVAVELTGGMAETKLERPPGVPLRVAVRGGVHQLAVDDLRLHAAERTGWQTPDFAGSQNRYDVIVAGGVSQLTIGSW